MAQPENAGRYKNAAINIAVIIVALVASYNIYKGNLAANGSLKARISEEEKKNIELEKIGRMEKKISAYKGLLPGKEASVVMDDIVGIAKASGVKVLSIKPSQGELGSDYIKSNFEVSVSAPGYDALARFINILETSNNVYIVDSIDIDKNGSMDNGGLTVNLRISSPAATGK